MEFKRKLIQFYRSNYFWKSADDLQFFIHKDIVVWVKSVHGRYFYDLYAHIESGIVNAYFSEQYLCTFGEP